ncbi:hypothetical protein AVEN_191121-1 [Araneus ventricosus]|uniref:Tc3 transposase DNA binding domain-containing protein n=1 Tax=Araneus ventricosus TaxID=182803 RepID=A0A4Y2B0P5_ARAVE|nr:hypothetical protein AVEN_191121-1 [Araneus ventricosus]
MHDSNKSALRRRGSISDSEPDGSSFQLYSTEDPPSIGGLMHVKSVEGQTLLAGVAWNFGQGESGAILFIQTLFKIMSPSGRFAKTASRRYFVRIYPRTLKSLKNWYGHAYANKDIWNQSEYGAAVGNAYIRQQGSGTVVRSVTAATMAGYQDLSEFERGVIVGAREMGHCISEVAMKFGFSRTTISRVYREYRESGKTSNLRHRCGR